MVVLLKVSLEVYRHFYLTDLEEGKGWVKGRIKYQKQEQDYQVSLVKEA